MKLKKWWECRPIKNFSPWQNWNFWSRAPFGPFLSPGDSREGPTCIQNCSTQCIWVVRIHITPLGPLTDLYGTPGPSKRALLAPKGPVGGPIGSRRAPGDQIWSQLLPIGLTGLESWLPHTLAWYLASSGPPVDPKGPIWALNVPYWPQKGLK